MLTILTGCPDPGVTPQTGIVIQYNANGSTKGTPPPAGVKTKGTPYIIADNTGGLEQDAKRFDCWNSKRDGTGTNYDPGASYTEEVGMNVYAKYTETYYTITYKANGETGGAAPAIQTRDIAKDIILAGKGSLQKTGFFLSGWNSQADGMGADYALGSTYTGKADITLYAKWEMRNEMISISPPAGAIVGQTVNYTLPLLTSRYGGVFVSGRNVTLSSFQMGKHEVSYELWYEVKGWAAGHGYTFANQGCEGSMGTDGAAPTANKKHPVTKISWHDAVVWCNACTEMSNGNDAQCVYRSSGAVIKDAMQAAVDAAVCDLTKKGYRLPTEAEWEYAARYQADNSNNNAVQYGSVWLTKLNAASGSANNWKDATETGAVAWYTGNSGSATHPAGQKRANALGLYDMSGNVYEWCFDRYGAVSTGTVTNPIGPASGSSRVRRGSSWFNHADYLALGYRDDATPGSTNDYLGFRLCRTQ